jgi:capsid protein
MEEYTKQIIKLQEQMADLANAHAIVKDCYHASNDATLIQAMEIIMKRLLKAEAELETFIKARDLDDKLPRANLGVIKKNKI